MPIPLYQKLYDYVKETIESGQRKPGERVQSEKELAEQFGVSRITSKKALEKLYDDGLIDRIQGKGSFVAQVPPPAEARKVRREERAVGSGLIGVLLPDLSESFGLNLLRSIDTACVESGFSMIFRLTHGDQRAEEAALQSLRAAGAQGVIILPVQGEFYNAELLRIVLDGFPVVLVDRYLRGISAPTVCSDNYHAAQRMVDYLLERGHQHIAFISPPAEHTSSLEERVRGFVERFAARGLALPPGYLLTDLTSTMAQSSGVEQVRADRGRLVEFLRSNPQLTAIFACEYNLALLADRVLDEMHELAARPVVVCFDSPQVRFGRARFSHIRQDEAAMGERALHVLAQVMRGESVPALNIVAVDLIEAEDDGQITKVLQSA